ncbi:MAG: Na(+)/H(+) antiporter subunit B [Anaerolineae bacterium]|nr:Na(+)/H(+) antiporter subunit B [Anaerolineae bacterium]
MTRSVFFQFVARVMLPVLLIFSLMLMLRGHNEAGGGFVGGLVASCGVMLMTLAYGPDEVRQRFKIDFLRLMFWGLLIAVFAGVLGLFAGGAFLEAEWWKPFIQGIGRLELGTPLLFDIGVYIIVLSVTSSIVMSMAEEGERND